MESKEILTVKLSISHVRWYNIPTQEDPTATNPESHKHFLVPVLQVPLLSITYYLLLVHSEWKVRKY